MNIAIELDPKIYDRVQKETVFIPIKNDLRKPEYKIKEEKKRTKLSIKERKALNHLSKTCLLISSLNNDDLAIMKKIKEKDIQNEKEEEKEKEN